MFKLNDMNINPQIIIALFKQADEDNSGSLDIDEFKALMNN
jgi:Ca2+-binding EF-hand superfamily protein